MTKKEYAKLGGVTTSDLSNYLKRGKVILSGEFIDDTIEPNKTFLEKRREKNKTKEQVAPEIMQPLALQMPPQINKPTTKAISQYDLEKRKLELENEKKEKEIEKLKIQIEKLNGILIPTDLSKMVIVQLSKSLSNAFKQAADNLLIEFSSVKNLSSKETATLRGTLVGITNKAVETGLLESKKMIRNIVNEYSDTRGKGERK